MPTKKIGNVEANVDDEGYLIDPKQWTREIAIAFAQELGITLTEAHWKVIDFIRKDGAEAGAAPNIRRITKVTSVSVKELYALFPNGPAKTAAKLAGYNKPQGCV